MNTSINNPVTINSFSKSEISSIFSLQEIESLVLQSIRKRIRLWIENSEQNPPEPTTRCRECGNVANYLSKRIGYVRTHFGLIRYQRAYYLCPHCHQGTCPLDERLNPVESLARLRTKVAAGTSLPVAELAQAWGLGSLDISPEQPPTSAEYHLASSTAGAKSANNTHARFMPVFC